MSRLAHDGFSVVINYSGKPDAAQALVKKISAARVVSFLVGPDGAWVNGQVVPVNGGIV